LREVVKDFRSKGKRIIKFLDDGLVGENDYDTAVKSSREVNDQLLEFLNSLFFDKNITIFRIPGITKPI
jgi:hypothetical protein